MKLCLFNVENLFLLGHPQGENYLKPIDKVEWIARTIKEIDADVTMLCEVGGKLNLDFFNSKYLDSNYLTKLTKGNSDRGIEMGYLIKKSFPYDSELISHSEDSIEFNYPHEIILNQKSLLESGQEIVPSHRFSRDISELRLFKNNDLKLILLLVHLKSKWDRDGIDSNGSMRRKAELKAVIKTYNSLKNQFRDQVPIIVAGDMNGSAQRLNLEPEFEEIYNSSDLEDIMELARIPYEFRQSFFYFGKDNKAEASQLDYIFIPFQLHHLIKKEDSGIYLFRDQYGSPLSYPKESYQRYALPSDHYPVVANLDFL